MQPSVNIENSFLLYNLKIASSVPISTPQQPPKPSVLARNSSCVAVSSSSARMLPDPTAGASLMSDQRAAQSSSMFASSSAVFSRCKVRSAIARDLLRAMAAWAMPRCSSPELSMPDR